MHSLQLLNVIRLSLHGSGFYEDDCLLGCYNVQNLTDVSKVLTANCYHHHPLHYLVMEAISTSKMVIFFHTTVCNILVDNHLHYYTFQFTFSIKYQNVSFTGQQNDYIQNFASVQARRISYSYSDL